MPQTIRKVVERSKRAFEVVLSDFEGSWHVMVIRLPDEMGTESRGLTLFEGLYDSQENADQAAEQFISGQVK